MARKAAVLLVLLMMTPLAGAAWTEMRHDAGHSARADDPGAIKAARERFAMPTSGAVIGVPAVAEVAGETRIFAASYVNFNVPGTVYSFRQDGSVAWSVTPVGSTGGYLASPTVADLDGAGDLEVVLASLDDSTVRAFNARTGAQIFATRIGNPTEDLIASSALVADLVPSRPGKEIAIGGSRSGEPGNLLILGSDGAIVQSIRLDGPSWSTPLLADLDGDGEDEMAIATGLPGVLKLLFPSAKTGGRSLYVLDRHGTSTWNVAWSKQLAGTSLASPAFGDIDRDGDLDLVVGSEGGWLYALDARTGATVGTNRADLGDLVAISSPVVHDIDDDGRLEIVVGTWDGVVSIEWTGTALVSDRRFRLPCVKDASGACLADPWVGASPTLGDVDGDGAIDVLAQTLPVRIDFNDILRSDALPGTVFALRGADFSPIWTWQMPKDGGLGGPILVDIDRDGIAEVLAGEGIPVIGDGKAVHVLSPRNPIVRGIATTPADPTDLDTIAFAATVTDEDTAAASHTYAWTFGDGAASALRAPSHRYADDGTYTVSLTVTDPEGFSWTTSRTVVVRNAPPTLSLAAATTPGSLSVGLTADAVDLDGAVTAIEWTLGDGATASGASVAHAYATGGAYRVVARAFDDDGDSTVRELTVAVNRAPALLAPADGTAREGEPFVVLVAGSDPDGDALRVAAIDGAPGATWRAVGSDLEITWIPPYNVATNANPLVGRTVTVRAEDLGYPALSADTTFRIDVENVDRPAAFDPVGPRVVTERVALVVPVRATDPDGDTIALSLAGLPAAARLVDNGDGTGRIEWTPVVGDAASYTATVTATSVGLTAARDIPITVRIATDLALSSPNRFPRAAPGETLRLPVEVTNTGPNSDVFRFTAVDTGGWTLAPPPDLALAPGQRATVEFAVTAPPSAAPSLITFRGSSLGNPDVTRALTFTADVPVSGSAATDKPVYPLAEAVVEGVAGVVVARFADGSPAPGVAVVVEQWPLGGAGPLRSNVRGVTDERGEFRFDFAGDPKAALLGSHELVVTLTRAGRSWFAHGGYMVAAR